MSLECRLSLGLALLLGADELVLELLEGAALLVLAVLLTMPELRVGL